MKKCLLSFILSVAGLGLASATEPVQGIIATYDGAETSYKLSDVPTVRYETIQGVPNAVLYVKDNATPVLSVPLAEGKTLTIVYGEYVPSAIDAPEADRATIINQGGKKFIKGGKLIIVGKDGRMYNAAGVEIIK